MSTGDGSNRMGEDAQAMMGAASHDNSDYSIDSLRRASAETRGAGHMRTGQAPIIPAAFTSIDHAESGCTVVMGGERERMILSPATLMLCCIGLLGTGASLGLVLSQITPPNQAHAPGGSVQMMAVSPAPSSR